MDLKETLSALEEMVPEVPGHATAVLEEGARYKEQVDGVLGLLAQMRDKARELFEQVNTGLTGVQQQAGQQHAAVSDALGRLEQASHEAVEAIARDRTELADSHAQATGAMEALQGALESAGHDAEQAEDRATAALAELTQTSVTAENDLSADVAAVLAEVDGLAEAARTVQQVVQARAAALEDALTEVLDRGQQRVEDVVSSLRDLRAHHLEMLEAEEAHLETRRSALVDAVSGRVEEDVEQALAAAVEATAEALQALAARLGPAAERVASVRVAVEAGLHAVEAALDPLPAGVEQVKEAARQVGLEFA